MDTLPPSPLPAGLAALRALPAYAVVIAHLDDGAQLDARDPLGRVPLHNFALHGNVPGALAVLDAGAPVDVRDYEGRTPLVLALLAATADPREHSARLGVARLLFDAGARLGQRLD